MIKRLIGLVIFLLIVNAGYRVGMVWFHNQQFEDAVREIALFGAGKTDEALKASVMKAADDNQVPLDDDFIEISRRTVVGTNDHVTIKFSYAVMVPLVPGITPRRFDFSYSTP
jgi:hypothetical protein